MTADLPSVPRLAAGSSRTFRAPPQANGTRSLRSSLHRERGDSPVIVTVLVGRLANPAVTVVDSLSVSAHVVATELKHDRIANPDDGYPHAPHWPGFQTVKLQPAADSRAASLWRPLGTMPSTDAGRRCLSASSPRYRRAPCPKGEDRDGQLGHRMQRRRSAGDRRAGAVARDERDAVASPRSQAADRHPHRVVPQVFEAESQPSGREQRPCRESHSPRSRRSPSRRPSGNPSTVPQRSLSPG